MVPAGIAAGHPATTAAGLEILEEGGSAADAAVAACLASCVAETVMSGLLGGGFAICYDAAAGATAALDFFVAVPSGVAGPMEQLAVPFGEEIVRYDVGAASCAVPGNPAGLQELWRSRGRLPWARLCEPAVRLARDGVPMPAAHASCLAMLEPIMTLREGDRIYRPGGRLLDEGDLLLQPGLVTALEALAAEGGGSAYSGTIARALLELIEDRDGGVTREDLRSYRPIWFAPAEVALAGHRFFTRGTSWGVAEAIRRLPPLRELSPTARVLALLEALDAPGLDGHTTNMVAVDADGSACVLTHSLGLGSGDWLPGLDLHLNSMLGETDLVVGAHVPGERMQSMMAPSLAFDGAGLALAIGAAGGTRLRTALVTAAAGILDEGLEPQAAVDRPRAHPTAELVNAEAGVDEDALVALEVAGRTVRRWPSRHHYFGGVSAIGRTGVAADPRRSGSARRLR
jgi:gamma-glutamyltranspeptidase/glutathione hydrolase